MPVKIAVTDLRNGCGDTTEPQVKMQIQTLQTPMATPERSVAKGSLSEGSEQFSGAESADRDFAGLFWSENLESEEGCGKSCDEEFSSQGQDPETGISDGGVEVSETESTLERPEQVRDETDLRDPLSGGSGPSEEAVSGLTHPARAISQSEPVRDVARGPMNAPEKIEVTKGARHERPFPFSEALLRTTGRVEIPEQETDARSSQAADVNSGRSKKETSMPVRESGLSALPAAEQQMRADLRTAQRLAPAVSRDGWFGIGGSATAEVQPGSHSFPEGLDLREGIAKQSTISGICRDNVLVAKGGRGGVVPPSHHGQAVQSPGSWDPATGELAEIDLVATGMDDDMRLALSGASLRSEFQPVQQPFLSYGYNSVQKAEIARAVALQMSESLPRHTNRMVEIMLNPEELGRVRMVVIPAEVGVLLHVNAERLETLDLMRRHIEHLAEELRQIGYDDVGFEFTSGDAESSGPDENDRRTLQAHELVPGSDGPQQTPSKLAPLSGLDIRV